MEPGGEATGPVLALTLEDAYRVAIENNIGLALGAMDEEVARVQAVGSWGAFDPLFNLGASYTDGEIPQSNPFITGGVDVLELEQRQLTSGLVVPLTSGGSFSIDANGTLTETNNQFAIADEFTDAVLGLGLTQPLLRGAWRTAATADQRESRLTWLIARERQRETLEGVLLNVSNAYWDLVAAIEEVRVRELSVELGRTQLEQERERERVGVGTEVDVLQAETQVATEQEQLLLARTDVQARSDALKALLFRRDDGGGWDDYLDLWDLPVRPLSPLPGDRRLAIVEDWRGSLARAFEHRPDLGRLRLEIDAAQVRLERAESDRLPLLDLNLGYQGQANDIDRSNAIEDALGFEFPTWNAGITFQQPLGNRSLRNAERAARLQLVSSRMAYEDAENQAIAAVRDAVRQDTYQVEALAAAVQSRAFAERQLEAEEVRYQEGLSTTFQVLEFQRDLAQALSNEALARSALAKAEAAVLSAEGRLVSRIDLVPATVDEARLGDPSEEPQSLPSAGGGTP